MMREKTTIKEPGDKSVFTVPEGYFEGMTDRINALIDQREKPEKSFNTFMHILPGRMERYRPLLYMAAMFVVLLFSITTILKLTSNKSDSGSLTKNGNKQQEQTAEDYLISQIGTYGIAEYYINPDLYEE
jgi:hypothetical protein